VLPWLLQPSWRWLPQLVPLLLVPPQVAEPAPTALLAPLLGKALLLPLRLPLLPLPP
jgi:hypothetical protein